MFEREWRDLAWVPRWSIIRIHRRQSVAEHSYFVALYAHDIAKLINFDGDFGHLQRMALIHDAEEAITGDAPGPAKRSLYRADADEITRRMVMKRFPHDPYEPNEQERVIIRTASLLDEALYLAGEIQMGNRAAESMLRRSIGRLRRIWRLLPAAQRDLEQWWTEIVDPTIDRELYQPSAIHEDNTDLEAP